MEFPLTSLQLFENSNLLDFKGWRSTMKYRAGARNEITVGQDGKSHRSVRNCSNRSPVRSGSLHTRGLVPRSSYWEPFSFFLPLTKGNPRRIND